MENMEKGNGPQILKKEAVYRLSLVIGEEEYWGEYPQNSDHFVAVNEQGKKIYVAVRDLSAADRGEQDQLFAGIEHPDQYPHLQLPVGVIWDAEKEFTCFPQKDSDSQENLEQVLFGKNMSLPQRLILSLSLAAAVSELESVFREIPVKQLRIDAFSVDTENYVITVDCRKLAENRTEEENRAEYQKMAKLGFMPPEWHRNPDQNPVSVQTLRHILAVCLFRIMCAEDPFDGEYTLRAYPYRGSEAISMIYGENAQYILNRNAANRANQYIGARAYTIFSLICPRLKRLFETAFIDGIKNPSERPSAAAWTENQKNMVSWFIVSGKEWRIADLMDGAGVFDGTKYLIMDNGIILPLINDKPLYQFMLDSADTPVNETMVGTVHAQRHCTELRFNDEKKTVIALNGMMETRLSGEVCGKVSDAPWKHNVKG